MKTLISHSISYKDLFVEVDGFEAILKAKNAHSEKELVKYLSKCPNIICSIHNLCTSVHENNKYAFEFPIYGDYSCDCLITDSNSKQYCFIEFEDAKEKSIFERNGKKATLDWAKRFEHGFSQLVDWFWKMDCCKSDPSFILQYGINPEFIGLLIIGRTSYLSSIEEHRVKWRQHNISIGGKLIHIFTYDMILDLLREHCSVIKKISSSI